VSRRSQGKNSKKSPKTKPGKSDKFSKRNPKEKRRAVNLFLFTLLLLFAVSGGVLITNSHPRPGGVTQTSFSGTIAANPYDALNEVYDKMIGSSGIQFQMQVGVGLNGIKVSGGGQYLLLYKGNGDADFANGEGSDLVSTTSSGKSNEQSNFTVLQSDNNLYIQTDISKLPPNLKNRRWADLGTADLGGSLTQNQISSLVLYLILGSPNLLVEILKYANSSGISTKSGAYEGVPVEEINCKISRSAFLGSQSDQNPFFYLAANLLINSDLSLTVLLDQTGRLKALAFNWQQETQKGITSSTLGLNLGLYYAVDLTIIGFGAAAKLSAPIAESTIDFNQYEQFISAK
jgi:hypothetical protein